MLDLQKFLNERDIRLCDREGGYERAFASLQGRLECSTTHIQLNEINEYLSRLVNICSDHDGLNSIEYIVHPIRVAEFCLMNHDEVNVTSVVKLALAHNVIEVSNLNEEQLRSLLGNEVISKVHVLTVNRKFRWDNTYLQDYYWSIDADGYDCSVVKCADKLDNIFLINLNPSIEVRRRYLQEIEEFVIPLADKWCFEFTTDLVEAASIASRLVDIHE